MRDDDLASFLEDYFRSGAAREDREAIGMQAKVIRHIKWAIRNLDLDGLNVTVGRIQRVIEREKHLTYSRQTIEAALEYAGQEDVEHRCNGYGADEEWSNIDDRFITPAIDLDAHTEQVLDTAYGPKETR